MKRHPEIRKRKPQHLQMVRAKQSNRIIVNHWFTSCLEPALQNLDLFNKPEQIYNVDESGFPLSWTPKTILTKKGQKTPQALLARSGRENITVQTCISGSGTLLPPYVVYKGERLMSNTTFGGPLASRYAVSHNGWMTEESFVDWLKALFIPSLPPTRPVLLILDGHKSHITYEVRELARGSNIHLLKLPPHTTHLLQPLDIGVFNRMKGTWQTTVTDITSRERRLISKSDFPRLLKRVWESFKSQWAVSAFSKTGIVPFNPNCIPDESFKLSEPFTLSEIEEPSNTPLSQSTVLPPLAVITIITTRITIIH